MRFLVIIWGIILLFFSCKQQNLVSQYNETLNDLEVTYKFVTNDDSTTRIVYTVNTSELIQLSSKNHKSFYFFSIENYDETKDELLHSYTTKIITAVLNPENTYTVNEFEYPYSFPQNSSVRIQMRNTTGMLFNSQTFYFEADSNKLDMYLLQNESRYDWTQPYVFKGRYGFTSKLLQDKQYVYLFANSKNDSLIDSLSVNNNHFEYTFTQKGTYLFALDSQAKNIFVIIPCVSNNFPSCNSSCEMLEAIPIFDSSCKIDSLKEQEYGCKIELDKYWLQIAHANQSVAKSLIKEYYNRVALANKRFTIVQQGMNTDRGKCLILFGEPISKQYSRNKEIWKYSNEIGNIDKEFIFVKSNSKFSDYLLQDKESKNIYFEHAVLNWKNGIIYRLQ